MTGFLPDVVCACVGGGSNSIGMFIPFIDEPVDIIGVEPLGRGKKLGDHAVAYAVRKAQEMKRGSILVCLSGRGDKDIDYVVENYGYGEKYL